MKNKMWLLLFFIISSLLFTPKDVEGATNTCTSTDSGAYHVGYSYSQRYWYEPSNYARFGYHASGSIDGYSSSFPNGLGRGDYYAPQYGTGIQGSSSSYWNVWDGNDWAGSTYTAKDYPAGEGDSWYYPYDHGKPTAYFIDETGGKYDHRRPMSKHWSHFSSYLDTRGPTAYYWTDNQSESNWVTNDKLTLFATDNGCGGVSAMRYEWVESPFDPINMAWSSTTTHYLTIPPSRYESLYLNVEVKDSFGNIEMTVLGPYHVDNTAPEFHSTWASSNWIKKGATGVVGVRGTDRVSGMNAVYLSLQKIYAESGNETRAMFAPLYGTLNTTTSNGIISVNSVRSSVEYNAYFGSVKKKDRETEFNVSANCELCVYKVYGQVRDRVNLDSGAFQSSSGSEIKIDGKKPIVTISATYSGTPSWSATTSDFTNKWMNRANFDTYFKYNVNYTEQGAGARQGNFHLGLYTWDNIKKWEKNYSSIMGSADGSMPYGESGYLSGTTADVQSAITQSGLYKLKGTLTDNVGNVSDVGDSPIIHLDFDKPYGGFSPNGTNQKWKQKETVVLSTGDSLSGIKGQRYRISNDNGATWGAWVSFDGDPMSATKETTIVLDISGLYKIQLEVTDIAENVNTMTSETYYIDSDKPTINITGVNDGGVYIGSVTPLFPTFPNGTIDNNGIYDTGGSGLDLSTLQATLTRTNNGITVVNNSYQSGTIINQSQSYTLRVYVEDIAGNFAEKTISFTVYALPKLITTLENTLVYPTQTLLTQHAYSSSDRNLARLTFYYQITERKTTGTVAHPPVALSNQTLAPSTTAPSPYQNEPLIEASDPTVSATRGTWITNVWRTFDLSYNRVINLNDGEHQIDFWVRDEQGAMSPKVTLNFQADTQAPTTIMLYHLPKPNSVVAFNNTIRFSIGALDPLASDGSYQEENKIRVQFEVRKNGYLIHPSYPMQIKLNNQPTDPIDILLNEENGFRPRDTITIKPIIDDGRGNLVLNPPVYTVDIQR